ncbi:MAG: hypothetical protein R2880_13455 [Deinococcales bacterium]
MPDDDPNKPQDQPKPLEQLRQLFTKRTGTIAKDAFLLQLFALLAPYKWRVIGLSLLISGAAALGTIAPQFVRFAFDVVIPSGKPSLFIYLALAFGLFYLLEAALGYASMYLSFAFTQSIISDIRMGLIAVCFVSRQTLYR